MPGVTAGVYTGSLDAGTEVSSTYEGRHVTVLETEIIHPYIADGFVNKGDPVVLCDAGVPTTYGHAVGVAFSSATAATEYIAIDTEGIWNLTVYAEDDNGNAAIEIGDPLYIRAGDLPGAADADGTGDAEISKIVDPATQVPFGYALGSIVAGGSGVIAVKVHWDPSEHWLQDNELMYFGDARDMSIEWNGTNLEILPVADDTGSILIGNGTLNINSFQIFGMTANDYVLYDTSVGLLTLVNTALGADARGTRQIGTVATPAMTDGYGVWEQELNVTGIATGLIAAGSSWINFGAGSTIGPYTFIHTEGIWDGGATLTIAYISWAKYTCMLASDPAHNSLWELNFDGANSGIDSMFNVNNAALSLGYVAGSVSTVIGSIPIFHTAGGALRGWIAVYDAEFA